MSLSCRQEKVFCGSARNTTCPAPRPPSADMLPRPGRCRGDGAAPARSPAPLPSVPPPVRAGRLGCPPSLRCLLTKSLNSKPTFSLLLSLPVSAPGKLRLAQQAEAGAAIAAFAEAGPAPKHQNELGKGQNYELWASGESGLLLASQDAKPFGNSKAVLSKSSQSKLKEKPLLFQEIISWSLVKQGTPCTGWGISCPLQWKQCEFTAAAHFMLFPSAAYPFQSLCLLSHKFPKL